jgi:uncharacterized protein
MRKLLLILLAIAAVAWWWRRGQRAAKTAARPDAVAAPQPMVCCARCGVHLPASNAVTGRAGRVYCCAAHRREAEGG